ncbi:hypothetical protein [uncultured Psychrobacter sp.]|uniref:hypothetical protein n=1 Tax=uncultured Psychrobacter sp. TaxID=259303 RepID=UPI002596B7E2|nr:hypothetical protein [uncultured Psychrobacter sp.]
MRLPDLNDLIADLQLAKDIAIRNENANSLVAATLAQAKLLGLDKPQPQQNEDVRLISELMDELSLESSKPRIIELVAPENVR